MFFAVKDTPAFVQSTQLTVLVFLYSPSVLSSSYVTGDDPCRLHHAAGIVHCKRSKHPVTDNHNSDAFASEEFDVLVFIAWTASSQRIGQNAVPVKV